jgi:hypothetical protein
MKIEIAVREWKYDESVRLMSGKIQKLKSDSIEVLQELWRAREALRRPGARTDLTSPKSLRGWTQYCEDIGISLQTASNWLARYDAKHNKLIEEPKPLRIVKPEKIEAEKEKELSDEWFDEELGTFWTRYETEHKDNPVPEGCKRISVDNISCPDTPFSRLCINNEILNFRRTVQGFDEIPKRIEKANNFDEGAKIFFDLFLLEDDLCHVNLFNMRELIKIEIDSNNRSHFENRLEVIDECISWAEDRAAYRKHYGYCKLPTDKMIPLAQSRKRDESKPAPDYFQMFSTLYDNVNEYEEKGLYK